MKPLTPGFQRNPNPGESWWILCSEREKEVAERVRPSQIFLIPKMTSFQGLLRQPEGHLPAIFCGRSCKVLQRQCEGSPLWGWSLSRLAQRVRFHQRKQPRLLGQRVTRDVHLWAPFCQHRLFQRNMEFQGAEQRPKKDNFLQKFQVCSVTVTNCKSEYLHFKIKLSHLRCLKMR